MAYQIRQILKKRVNAEGQITSLWSEIWIENEVGVHVGLKRDDHPSETVSKHDDHIEVELFFNLDLNNPQPSLLISTDLPISTNSSINDLVTGYLYLSPDSRYDSDRVSNNSRDAILVI